MLALLEDSPDQIRRQAVVAAWLQLAVLSGIALVHVLFSRALGSPPAVFFGVLLGGFTVQALALAWLQGGAVPHPEALRRWAHVSIWGSLALAFALSLLAAQPDSHYVVLTVLPVVSAAFRYRRWALAVVVAVAATITVAEIGWLPHRAGRDLDEYFEAASVVLVYVVVAAVVSALAADLRREHRALAASRDRLLDEERLAAVGRLAGALAHEIRNPVAMITSSLALARRGGPGALEPRELEDIVQQEASRLERLTADFLRFARPAPPAPVRGRLDDALGYVAELARARAAEAGVEVAVRAAAVDADFDPFQIHQALLNLALNAIEAAPPSTRVLLTAGLENGDAVLRVEDAGPAIDQAAARRIFEPFFTTKPGGTGLGLAIARSIARAHGGDVELEANRPGEVRFALRWPRFVAAMPRVEVALGAHPAG